MDEDGKIYRGAFGTLGGQLALTRLMEESGFFDATLTPESVAARNFVIHILHKMEVFKHAEDRIEFVRHMLQKTSERYVEQVKTEDSRRKR